MQTTSKGCDIHPLVYMYTIIYREFGTNLHIQFVKAVILKEVVKNMGIK
jgi:hypothetical protein